MKLSDEIRIEAPRTRVFAALNDADVLRRSIPGCEALDQISDTEFAAVVRAKVGPVKARFKGNVVLSDMRPPESYTLSGEGKGGAAGFANGAARVALVEDGAATVLRYDVDATVGGKLAQLGGRLIETTSKSLASEFFEKFRAAVEGTDAEAETVAETSPHTAETRGLPRALVWLGAGLLAALALYLLVGGA